MVTLLFLRYIWLCCAFYRELHIKLIETINRMLNIYTFNLLTLYINMILYINAIIVIVSRTSCSVKNIQQEHHQRHFHKISTTVQLFNCWKIHTHYSIYGISDSIGVILLILFTLFTYNFSDLFDWFVVVIVSVLVIVYLLTQLLTITTVFTELTSCS